MYCKKCGRRLTGRETVCPYCGAQGQPVEYSNGFWDLYQDGPTAPPCPVPSEHGGDGQTGRAEGDLSNRLTRLEQQIKRMGRQVSLLFRGLLIAAGLVLLLAFFLVLHACGAGEAEQAVGPAQTRAEETETTVQTRDRAANVAAQTEDHAAGGGPDESQLPEEDTASPGSPAAETPAGRQ